MYRTYSEKTVDEAVAAGLRELGVTEDDIKIEVLDAGSGGFLGFGKRQAEVKLSIINPELKTYETIEALIESRKANEAAVEEDVRPVEDDVEVQKEEVAAVPSEVTKEVEVVKEDPVKNRTEDKTSALSEAASKTADYISNVVAAMDVPNTVEIHLKDTTVTIEFHAALAAKIIGKRGQTLNALQELAQNYFNTIYKSYGKVFLDVENYREKRRETLEALALNMSKKAMQTNEPIKMEPMPSFERKTMHHVLSRIRGIETYSEGKEPNRYLVIIKK